MVPERMYTALLDNKNINDILFSQFLITVFQGWFLKACILPCLSIKIMNDNFFFNNIHLYSTFEGTISNT